MGEVINLMGDKKNIRLLLTDALANVDKLCNVIIGYSINEDDDIVYAFRGNQDEIRSVLLEMLIGEVLACVFNKMENKEMIIKEDDD